MNWQLTTVIFTVGVLLSVIIGRSRLQRSYRPAADFLLIMGAAFLGVYAALALTGLNQHQLEQEQVVVLLRAAKIDAEAYRKYLAYSPSEQSDQDTEPDLTDFFRSNPRSQPLIIDKLLAEDILLRHISAVSYYNMTVLLGNIRKAQVKINSGTTTAEDGQNLVNMNLKEIELLSKMLSWEMLYQQGIFSEEKLNQFSEQLF